MSSQAATPTDFVPAIRTCLAKYATFGGRAGRAEFWLFQLFLAILLALAGVVEGDDSETLSTVVVVLFALPQMAAISRRLHDRDMPAGWLALLLLPGLGLLFLLGMCIPAGDEGPNGYGPRTA